MVWEYVRLAAVILLVLIAAAMTLWDWINDMADEPKMQAHICMAVKIEDMLSHSAFWATAFQAILNIAPMIVPEMNDSPLAMKITRIAVACSFVGYWMIRGTLSAPATPPDLKSK